MSEFAIVVSGLTKAYGSVPVLSAIDLDVPPRFQQGRYLPPLNVKRLQHFDELVDDHVALLPQEVHSMVGVRKVDRGSVSNELI